MTNTIEFFCWDKDMPLQVQLEPEAILYVVNPGDTIKFIPIDPTSGFRWGIRLDNDSKAIQLFPENFHDYQGIEVYLNSKIIDKL